MSDELTEQEREAMNRAWAADDDLCFPQGWVAARDYYRAALASSEAQPQASGRIDLAAPYNELSKYDVGAPSP